MHKDVERGLYAWQEGLRSGPRRSTAVFACFLSLAHCREDPISGVSEGMR